MTRSQSRRQAILSCVVCALFSAPLAAGCVSIFSADEGAFVEGAEDSTSGVDDTSGVDGTSGTSGADGTSGTSGADGTSGTSGADADPDGASDDFTPPVITITPAQPVSIDDLTVVIEQEATHTSSGPITYAYTWTRTGQPVATLDNVPVVDDALTKRGEVWTVTVTPSLADGSATGQGVSASVTIQNSLPVVRSASLDTYRPFAHQEVTVRIEDVFDADNDTIAPVIRWFKNDTALTVTGAKLNLANQTWADGDTLRVELSAYDNAGGQVEGPKLVIGPMPVNQPAPHWKPLYPTFASSDGPGGTLLFDPFNHRLLFINQGLLWEASPPPAGEAPRWVALNPVALDNAPVNSTPFFYFPIVTFDEGADFKRILFIGASAATADLSDSEVFSRLKVIELDVTRRGAERWIDRTPLLGDTPPFTLIPSTLLDSARDRLLIFGGLSIQAQEVYNSLWSLDLSLRGGENWVQITPTNEMPARGGAIWIKDPNSDQTLLVGGFGPKAGGGNGNNFEYVSDVWSVDISEAQPTYTSLLTTAPGNIAGFIETFGQPEVANLLMTTSAADGHKLWRFDFDTKTFSPQPQAQSPAASDDLQIFSAFITPGAKALVLNTIATQSDSSGVDAHILDLDAGAWSALVSAAQTPGSLKKAMSFYNNRNGDGFFVYGGLDDRRNETRDKLWRFDLDDMRWAEVTVTPDPTHGAPVGRYGHGLFTGREWDDPSFFSGAGASAPLSDAWRLYMDQGTSPRWGRLDNPSPLIPAPAPREGHARVSDCYGQTSFMGGHQPNNPQTSASVSPISEYYLSSCTRSGNYEFDCDWSPHSFQNATPSALSYPAVSILSAGSVRQSIYFGGQTEQAVSNTLMVLDQCSTWMTPNVSATAPTARAGASLVLDRRTEQLTAQRFYLFGGTDDLYGYSGMDDLWSLDRSASGSFRWTQLTVDGIKPAKRSHHGAVWDSNRNQMIVFGGDRYGDIWAFVPAPAPVP
jgi:hypothetical protein